MTWEIVVGLTILCSAAAAIGGPLWKLSQALTKLDVTINGLNKTVNEDRQLNREEHTEMRSQLNNHEGRITKLEWKEGANK